MKDSLLAVTMQALDQRHRSCIYRHTAKAGEFVCVVVVVLHEGAL